MAAFRRVCLSATLICGHCARCPRRANAVDAHHRRAASTDDALQRHEAPPTYPSTYPSAYPSTYPSTAAPAASAGIPPYDRPPPSLVASAAGVPGGSPGPSLTADPGPLGVPNNPGPVYGPYASPNATAASQPLDPNSFVERNLTGDEPWSWQMLPTGLMYKIVSGRQPRAPLGQPIGLHERGRARCWIRPSAAAWGCCATAPTTTCGRKAGNWTSKRRPSRVWTPTETSSNAITRPAFP